VVQILGGGLILWALINWRRFRGMDRRQPRRDVTHDDVADWKMKLPGQVAACKRPSAWWCITTPMGTWPVWKAGWTYPLQKLQQAASKRVRTKRNGQRICAACDAPFGATGLPVRGVQQILCRHV